MVNTLASPTLSSLSLNDGASPESDSPQINGRRYSVFNKETLLPALVGWLMRCWLEF
jgi:hypothetical protein